MSIQITYMPDAECGEYRVYESIVEEYRLFPKGQQIDTFICPWNALSNAAAWAEARGCEVTLTPEAATAIAQLACESID